MPSFILILDSNEFILGLGGEKEASSELLDILKGFTILIPEIIAEEVKENLRPEPLLLNNFLDFIFSTDTFRVIADLPPEEVVKKFAKQLKPADALIAAYCKWLGVDYLISENRHFLKGFKPEGFEVLSASDFLKALS